MLRLCVSAAKMKVEFLPVVLVRSSAAATSGVIMLIFESLELSKILSSKLETNRCKGVELLLGLSLDNSFKIVEFDNDLLSSTKNNNL